MEKHIMSGSQCLRRKIISVQEALMGSRRLLGISTRQGKWCDETGAAPKGAAFFCLLQGFSRFFMEVEHPLSEAVRRNNHSCVFREFPEVEKRLFFGA